MDSSIYATKSEVQRALNEISRQTSVQGKQITQTLAMLEKVMTRIESMEKILDGIRHRDLNS